MSKAALHGVVETAAYVSDAERAGLTENDRTTIVGAIAADPKCGDLIKGSGGARKVRFAGRGKGKSGG